MMSKNIKMFAAIGVSLFLVGCVLFGVHRYKNDPYRVMSPIVESMVRDLAASKWSGDVLKKYATPEFQKWLIDNNAAGGMPGFAYLGKVDKFIGIRQLTMNNTKDFVALTAECQFKTAPGYVILQLSKRNGQWLIYSFSVESVVFNNINPDHLAH